MHYTSATFQRPRRSHLLFFLAVFALGLGLSARAQSPARCAFDRHLTEWRQDETFLASRRAAEAQVAAYAKTRYAHRGTSNPPTIPVVVHVFHTGQAPGTAAATGENASDAQIHSAITDLNHAFAHTGPYASKGEYSAVTNVRFALAKTAPDGSATTGILRHDVSGESWGAAYGTYGMRTTSQNGPTQDEMTAGRFWPPTDYMNVYLTHKIDGGTNTLGFATFPESSPGTRDGLTVLTSAFGYDPDNNFAVVNDFTNLNGTTDHEVGHYLNLYHTFTGDNNGQACPTDQDCGTSGDCCADIPAHKRTDSACPALSATGNDCGGGTNVYIHNFMNYSSDECFHGFSNDQKVRMEAALAGPRKELGNSRATEMATGAYPAALTTAPSVATGFANTGITNVTVAGVSFPSWSTQHDGGYVNRVGSRQTVDLQPGNTYTVSVAVGTPGAATTDKELAAVYVDYNNDGDFVDAGEELFKAAPGQGKNNGEAFTFQFAPPTGVLQNQRLRLRVISEWDNSAITSTTATQWGGQIEDYAVRIGAPLPVTLARFEVRGVGRADARLTWATSAERDNAGFVVERGPDGEHFAEVALVSALGSAAGGEYAYTDRDLAPGTYYYRLRQLDLDGTPAYSPTAAVEVASALASAHVSPNPTRDAFVLGVNGAHAGEATVRVFGAGGQLMSTRDFAALPEALRLGADLPAGLYVIVIEAGSERRRLRVVKTE